MRWARRIGGAFSRTTWPGKRKVEAKVEAKAEVEVEVKAKLNLNLNLSLTHKGGHRTWTG